MLLDTFKRNEEPLSNGGKWTANGRASNAGKTTTEKGWATTTGVGQSGAHWNVQEFTEPTARVRFFPEDQEHSDNFRLYVCYAEQAGKHASFYALIVTSEGHGKLFRVEIAKAKETEGAGEELQSANGVHIPEESTIEFSAVGGVLRAKIAGVTILETSDATFTKGFVGMEEQIGEPHTPVFGVTNFEAHGKEALPEVENPGPQTSAIGTSVELDIKATNTLEYKATGLPKGLSINAATGVITGMPTTEEVTIVTVTVSNEEGSAHTEFTWTISGTTPTNIARPTITGPAVQGFVETEGEGTWEHGPILTRAYLWKRSGTAIEGATGKEYVPTVADIGHTLTVVETVTNSAGSSSAESLPTPAIEAGIPVATSLPTVNGPALVGEVEYEGHASWTVPVESYRFQWYLCDAKGESPRLIEGATQKTYVPVVEDIGHTLRVSEVAVDKAGESAPAVSLPSPIIETTHRVGAGLPPIQPEVNEPILLWPFRMASDESHIEFIEQDSPREVEQCVALTLLTRPGEFPDEPSFGLPDPTFEEGGISEANIAATVQRWEPRAHLFFTLSELVGFTEEVAIEVKTSS